MNSDFIRTTESQMLAFWRLAMIAAMARQITRWKQRKAGSKAYRLLMPICCLCCLVCFCSQTALPSFALETTITFHGDRVTLVYQPPFRSGPGSEHPTSTDIPQINVVVNLLDNYLTYLAKLQHVTEGTSLRLEYAPGQPREDALPEHTVALFDLGLNSVLQEVNSCLVKNRKTNESALCQTAEELQQIRDQLVRTTTSFETRLGFTNISAGLEQVEPESDFVLMHDGHLLTLRPTGKGNQIIHFNTRAPQLAGTVFLAPGKRNYADICPSPNGNFVAFTEGGEVKLASLASASWQVTEPLHDLFPQQREHLLGMAWAPSGTLLAGVIMDENSAARTLFVFDALTREHHPLVIKQREVDGDHQYAFPIWAPNGTRLFFCSGNHLHLFDFAANRIVPDVFQSPALISEVIWSPDSRSFALVEVEGQSRLPKNFDSRDFRSNVLRRFSLDEAGKAMEEKSQTFSSPHTIKLVSFWTLDRILFLEGNLRSQKIPGIYWNLSGVMSARLTPTPQRPVLPA